MPEIDPKRVKIRELVAKLPTIVQNEGEYINGNYIPFSEWPGRVSKLISGYRTDIRRIGDPDIEEDLRDIIRRAIRQARSLRLISPTEDDYPYYLKRSIVEMSVVWRSPLHLKILDLLSIVLSVIRILILNV